MLRGRVLRDKVPVAAAAAKSKWEGGAASWGGKTSLKTPTGSKATPPPTITVAEMSNRAFFITIKGMTQQHSEDNIKYELQKYLKLEHSNLVSSVKASKKTDLFIVYCDTWESAKIITNTYKDKFLNHDVSFTLFSKEDPALKTSQ